MECSELKNTQLRRLNKVLYKGDVNTIDCITPGYVALIEHRPNEYEFGSWIDLDCIEFIPLTEEMLLKCGFELKGSIFRLNNGMINQFDINKKLIGNCFYYDKSKNGIQSFIELKYIHQLQNIYGCLCGEELNVNM